MPVPPNGRGPGLLQEGKGLGHTGCGEPGCPSVIPVPTQPSCSWEGGSVGGWLILPLRVPGHSGQRGLKPALPVPGRRRVGGVVTDSRLPGRPLSSAAHGTRLSKPQIPAMASPPLLELRWAQGWQPSEGFPWLVRRHRPGSRSLPQPGCQMAV